MFALGVTAQKHRWRETTNDRTEGVQRKGGKEGRKERMKKEKSMERNTHGQGDSSSVKTAVR